MPNIRSAPQWPRRFFNQESCPLIPIFVYFGIMASFRDWIWLKSAMAMCITPFSIMFRSFHWLPSKVPATMPYLWCAVLPMLMSCLVQR